MPLAKLGSSWLPTVVGLSYHLDMMDNDSISCGHIKYKDLTPPGDPLVRFFQPQSVLELGSGNGINVIALALLNPHVKFTGLELTEGGITTANRFLKNPPLESLCYITELSESEIRRNLAVISIQFIQSSMLDLPFRNNTFDCVFSCTAVEQLPRDYKKAFKKPIE